MSRIITVKAISAKIVFKSLDILKQALTDCMHSQVGSWITEVSDYSGTKTGVLTGIKTSAFQRGIGFVKVGDRYEAKADFYNMEMQGRKLMNEITKNYQKHANLTVLREFHYIPTAVPAGEQIMITARQY